LKLIKKEGIMQNVLPCKELGQMEKLLKKQLIIFKMLLSQFSNTKKNERKVKKNYV